MNAPQLTRLKLETGGLPAKAARSVAVAYLPNVSHLEIWFGTEDYGGSCSAQECAAILANPSLGAVRTLGLKNADFQNAICEVVVKSPLIAQLTRLDLSMGTMTEEGAGVLLKHADHFRHLDSLSVNDNQIAPDVVERLRAALPNLESLSQRDWDDDWRYTSVGE